MKTLFDIGNPARHPGTGKKCKQCDACERWECNSKFFFYCGYRKSNRTENGLLKIKANMDACNLFIKKK